MKSLTPEQIAYKEKTLDQLQTNQATLEARFSQESRPEILRNIQRQLDDIRAHIDHLQGELAEGVPGEPVADELCERIAQALTKEKFYLAKKYINKLETIEPFYPSLELLRAEAEAERASRRTRSIAQGTAPPYGAAAFPQSGTAAGVGVKTRTAAANELAVVEGGREEREGISRFFQFHIVASCLVMTLIVCVALGMGGIIVLQWLIEGG